MTRRTNKFCPICGKEMEADDWDEYEEGDLLFCFDCCITDDSPSYYRAKRRQKEAKEEYFKEAYGENWEDMVGDDFD